MTRRDETPETPKTAEPEIPFADEKGMFGTSPIEKELTDEEVEFLTSRTAPRARLTRSKRKIVLYINLFLILFFLVRLSYHRVAPVTGFIVPPVFGLDEIGLTVVCAGLAAINWFMISPEDKSILWMVRFLGTGVPLLLLGALFALPPETIHALFPALYR